MKKCFTELLCIKIGETKLRMVLTGPAENEFYFIIINKDIGKNKYSFDWKCRNSLYVFKLTQFPGAAGS